MRRACERGLRVFDYGRSKRGTGSFDFKKNWGFEPMPLAYEYRLFRATRSRRTTRSIRSIALHRAVAEVAASGGECPRADDRAKSGMKRDLDAALVPSGVLVAFGASRRRFSPRVGAVRDPCGLPGHRSVDRRYLDRSETFAHGFVVIPLCAVARVAQARRTRALDGAPWWPGLASCCWRVGCGSWRSSRRRRAPTVRRSRSCCRRRSLRSSA